MNGQFRFWKTILLLDLPQAIVRSYPEDPGTDARFIPEFWQLLPHNDKRILRQVLCQVKIIHISHTKTKYLLPVRFIDLVKIHLRHYCAFLFPKKFSITKTPRPMAKPPALFFIATPMAVPMATAIGKADTTHTFF